MTKHRQPLIIYHSPCADGFMAACVADRFFGLGNAAFLPANYGDTPPATELLRDRDVYVLDFSYPKRTLEFMAAHANRVLVLDHHASAEKLLVDVKAPEPADPTMIDVRPYAWPFAEEDVGQPTLDGPRALFDMNRSGAGMAWDFFFYDSPRPPAVALVEDRDLWRFAIPGSKAFAARLFAEPYDFFVWAQVLSYGEAEIATMIREGELLLKKQDKDIRELLAAQAGRIEEIGGYMVPVYNLPYIFASDALHIACDGHPFAASYWDGPTHRNFSLRSDMSKGGVDVSGVAAEYGGGGHQEAAGFRVARQRGRLAVGG